MRVIREFGGIELEEISRATGFKVEWLKKVEEKQHDPTLDQAQAIAKVMGVHRLSVTGPIFDCSFETG
jgi:transcriptional regulator with XRE-family HTH domain